MESLADRVRRVIDWSRAKDKYGLTPFLEGVSLGVVVAVKGSRIVVQLDNGSSVTAPAAGFGDFDLQSGDEVAVGPDVFGTVHAWPAAENLVDRLPEREVSVGDSVDVDGRRHNITQESTSQAINRAIRGVSLDSSSCWWLRVC